MPEQNEPLPLKDLDCLLQQTLGAPLTVQVTDWKHLTDPGENFGSFIIAINVGIVRNNNTSKQEVHHLVCKMPPRSDYLLDLFNSPMTFKKELHFYNKIAPAFLQLQVGSMRVFFLTQEFEGSSKLGKSIVKLRIVVKCELGVLPFDHGF